MYQRTKNDAKLLYKENERVRRLSAELHELAPDLAQAEDFTQCWPHFHLDGSQANVARGTHAVPVTTPSRAQAEATVPNQRHFHIDRSHENFTRPIPQTEREVVASALHMFEAARSREHAEDPA